VISGHKNIFRYLSKSEWLFNPKIKEIWERNELEGWCAQEESGILQDWGGPEMISGQKYSEMCLKAWMTFETQNNEVMTLNC
jgi:hypothetical protein